MNMSNEIKPMTKIPPPLPQPEHEVPVEGRIAALLKAPRQIGAMMAEEKEVVRNGVFFLVTALLLHAIFGFAVGLFGGFTVAGMAAVKAPLIVLCSLLLCFPSLYVFSAVGGAPLSLGQTFLLGVSCLAMVGVLLIGLAPVAWLFAVSTESLPFVVVLIFVLWIVALCFTARYIDKLRDIPLFRRTGGINAWVVVFVLVALQMTTCMRPLLGKPDPARGWWTSEKKFFLAHFGSLFEDGRKPTVPGAPNSRR